VSTRCTCRTQGASKQLARSAPTRGTTSGNWNPDASRPDGSEKALPAGERRKGQAENSSRKGENRFGATRPGLAKSRRKIQTAKQLTATGVQRGTQGIKEEKDEIWPCSLFTREKK
jgi:hypothetical protein